MSGAERKLVLVADDEKDIAEIVCEMLEGEGYETVQAHDGEETLRMIRSRRPGAAVLDIKMPGIDGLEVIRRLRQDPDLKALPIVVLTATRIIRELEEEFRQLKVHSWMAKPFEPDQLIAAVKSAFGDPA